MYILTLMRTSLATESVQFVEVQTARDFVLFLQTWSRWTRFRGGLLRQNGGFKNCFKVKCHATSSKHKCDFVKKPFSCFPRDRATRWKDHSDGFSSCVALSKKHKFLDPWAERQKKSQASDKKTWWAIRHKIWTGHAQSFIFDIPV